MGQEVKHAPHFHKTDYTRFHKALVAETELARQHVRRGHGFASKEQATVGMELEVSLVDAAQLRPACISRELLVYLQEQKDQSTAAATTATADEAKDSKGNDGSGLTDELGQFQLEYNSPVFTLSGTCLRQMQDDLQSFWDRTDAAAVDHFDAHLLAIGTLPTLRPENLGLSSMSDRNRYRALNEQLLRQRHGRPVHLDIHCLPDNVSEPPPSLSSVSSTSPSSFSSSSLALDHPNCMLEAICCSFQLHWQVPCQQSARYFNAGLLISPILVAVTANSPIVLGHLSSWQESRIPVFEQGFELHPRRVWLGSGFVRDSVVEVFEQNLDIPTILPENYKETPRDQFRHLKLHNGSVWRWHRPLIGTDPSSVNTVGAGGDSIAPENERVHLRIEHRTMPAGPTVVDSIANAAFYYGMVEELANLPVPPESMCTFETVETNFYRAAERGLEAEIEWLYSDKPNPTTVQNVVLERLLPAARRGLERLKIDAFDAEYYLGIIERRVKTGQTGAVWQRRWVAKYGQLDTQALTSTYWAQQKTGRPCSEWDV
jgi:gamma-glutamyl:cysteine ligase YbdK (ATP-grasp superfamily)